MKGEELFSAGDFILQKASQNAPTGAILEVVHRVQDGVVCGSKYHCVAYWLPAEATPYVLMTLPYMDKLLGEKIGVDNVTKCVDSGIKYLTDHPHLKDVRSLPHYPDMEKIGSYNTHYISEFATKQVMKGRLLWTGQERTLFCDGGSYEIPNWNPLRREEDSDVLMRHVVKLFPDSGFEISNHGDSYYVFGRAYKMSAGLWNWDTPCKIFGTLKELATVKTIVAVETFRYLEKEKKNGTKEKSKEEIDNVKNTDRN